MKKRTLAIVLVLVGLLVCVGLWLVAGILYFRSSAPLQTLNPTTPTTTAANSSPLVGKWLCNDCGGRIGVSMLREYLADGTWMGQVTDANGGTYDYHGTYRLLGSNQYSEIDLTDAQNPAPQPGIYKYQILGDKLILELAEGETLTAEFQRVK